MKSFMQIVHEDMEYMNSAGISLGDVQYFIGANGNYNAYIIINKKMYRVRVETLVINNDNNILAQKLAAKNHYNVYYKIPGGSLDPSDEPIDQAEAEVHEEARITIKDIIFSGISYVQSYNGNYPEWQVKKLWPMGYRYEGSVSFVYTAYYEGKYTKKIKKVDQDDFYKHAKFYPVKELKLRKEHVLALSKRNNSI